MVLGFTSSSEVNLKFQFISGFAVGVELEKSPVLKDFFSIANTLNVVSRLYKKKLVFSPTVCFQETRTKNIMTE